MRRMQGHFGSGCARTAPLHFLDPHPYKFNSSLTQVPLPARRAATSERFDRRNKTNFVSFRPPSTREAAMKLMGFAAALVLAMTLFHPVAATTGTVGYEAGVIAIVVVLLILVVSMGIGLSVCLYRNDLIPCLANDPTKA